MRILRDMAYIDDADAGAVAAIGNFDGVHLGHQAVIEQARRIAAAAGAPLGVMTFEPHPRTHFAPDAPPFRLMNAEARAHRLEKLGVETLYEVPFNAGLAALTPEDFAARIIRDQLRLQHVVVGQDFCFGKDRKGTTDDLARFGDAMGFGVTVAEMVEMAEREISSTAIRQALSDGQPREAAAMLGHWHRIEGEVLRGFQRGRDLGYPTANMSISGLHPPKFGIYAVKVDILTGPQAGSFDGAASIGVRPTFDGTEPNCETYLFDFKGDLYGQRLSVGLVEFLRPELKFTDVKNLVRQMDDDCARARKILAHV